MVKKLKVVHMERCIGCLSCMITCSREVHDCFSTSKSAILVKTQGGEEGNFVVVKCRACSDPPCAEVCPEDALKPREGGGVVLIAEKCNGCGQCVDGCIVGAITMDEESAKPIICIHCGHCVKFCPHGVLGLEETKVY
ncbi:MAG: 4Fe-4S binding protein [Thermoplasmata archaeon]|nr:MAG: 4Fe-4S binding protein [Thermoplasmata archaeon]